MPPEEEGGKGSRAPTKRRPSVPIERRIEQYSPSSGFVPNTCIHTSGVDVHLSPTIASSLSAPISVTIGGSVTSLPPSDSFASPVAPVYPTIPPIPFGPSISPYSTYYPTMCPSSYQPAYMPYPTPTPTFDPTNGGLHRFRVHFISGNISVCNGCKKKYGKALGPPFNICLQHEEWRSFTPHGSSEKQNRLEMCTTTAIQPVSYPSGQPSFPPQ